MKKMDTPPLTPTHKFAPVKLPPLKLSPMNIPFPRRLKKAVPVYVASTLR